LRPELKIDKSTMTALKYRKVSVILGYTQAIICSVLLGVVIRYTIFEGLNVGVSIFSIVSLAFMIVKSYMEVTRKGTKIRISNNYIYTIISNGTYVYQFECFELICILCIGYPFVMILGDYILDIFCILAIVSLLIIGLFHSMPSKKNQKMIEYLESYLKIDFLLKLIYGSKDRTLDKTVSDVKSRTQRDLLETFPLNW